MRQLKINPTSKGHGNGCFERYLLDIDRENLIPPDEEVELTQKIKKGDEKALEKLVRANLRFVISVAKQYQNQGLSLSDLINEGNLGLIKAAKKFDEKRGFKFISFAVWWIRQSILLALAENGRVIRLPLNRETLMGKVKKEINKFEQTNERSPLPSEIAEIMNCNPKDIVEIISYSSHAASLDSLFQDDSGYCLLDKMESPFPETDNDLIIESNFIDANRALSILPERSRTILINFFGVGCRAKTLDEIGGDLKLSKERVRQLKEESINLLKKLCDDKTIANN